ncbi:acyltransferase family protein [Pseudonocardia sp. GCM10023141]|uniref:acyltransferase family protein n=1 Tax=Pseudonocardia sp. GCM10023141 TaxID=3252653 RepID=UPI00361CF3AC
MATGRHDPALPGAARRRYDLLDGLRAIAALMVVGYHARTRTGADDALWDGGLQLNMGVTVFFVLSGFLLYRPFVAARLSGSPGPHTGRYLRRRVLRVVPAYWVAITVLGLTLPFYVPVLTGDWWLFYSLGQTWAPGRMFDGLAPAWSLSVEASFYLALPLYAMAFRRCTRRMTARQQVRIEFALLAVVLLITVLARRFAFSRGDGPLGFLVWSLLGHADWFAGGLALAVASVLWETAAVRPRWVRFVERRPNACWGAAAAIFGAAGFVHGSPGDVIHILSLAVAVLLVAPAIFGDETAGAARRFLAMRSIRWLGLISFGIFLWNEPLSSWFNANGWNEWGFLNGDVPLFVLTAAAAIVAGAISYYAVERPLLARSGPRSRHRAQRNSGSTPREYPSAEPRPAVTAAAPADVGEGRNRE